MNYPQSIWSSEPMSTGIAALVCYAAVFNDVIGVEEMAARLGVAGKSEFYEALEELRCQDRIVVRDGFVGLPCLEDKISAKAPKVDLTKKLIASRISRLRKIGRNPLVKFLGISGSLAAENPTRDRNGRLDIDLFVITRSQHVWLYVILNNIKNSFFNDKKEPELCMNYVIDEKDLLIPNRNIYTATEIINLIPVSGFGMYERFIQANRWINFYYPGVAGGEVAVDKGSNGGITSKIYYILYTILRSIHWVKLGYILNISFKVDSHGGINFRALRTRSGGYQPLIQEKFCHLAEKWFCDLLGEDLMKNLFPDELSEEIRAGKIDGSNMGYDYSKYG